MGTWTRIVRAMEAAFSKEMADADGEMLVEYGAMDAMEPLPQETVRRELGGGGDRRAPAVVVLFVLFN